MTFVSEDLLPLYVVLRSIFFGKQHGERVFGKRERHTHTHACFSTKGVCNPTVTRLFSHFFITITKTIFLEFPQRQSIL